MDNKNGYKNSPVGWIPAEWEVKRFTEVCELKHGFQFREEHFVDSDGIPVVKIGNIEADGDLKMEGCSHIPKERLEEFINFQLYKGDILMALTGGTLGKMARIKKDYGIILQNYRVGNFKPFDADKDFVYFLLQSFFIQKKIEDLVNQAAQPNIGKGDFDKITFPSPPLPEQRAIAAVLRACDETLEKTQALLAALRRRHAGLMQALLSGKKRVKGLEREWKMVTFGDILKEVKRKVTFDDECLYRLISVKRRSGGLFHRDSLYGRDILTKNLSTAKKGDFLFSKMQILHGASGLVTEEFDGMMISGSYIAVVANEKLLDIEFFNWFSKMPYFYHQTYISSYGVHIEKMTFDFETFLIQGLKIPATIEEQRAITTILQASEAEIRGYERQAALLQRQKKGLMQVLLTGRVRVKNAGK